ncbi:MAG: hypothetical protein JW889_11585 [Verrucomicrobia bacterium]|nr:hypothetical protein [Verrucomicrobiota bacterium]
MNAQYVSAYVWDFPQSADEPVRVEVLLPLEDEDTVDLHIYPIVYHPFTFQQLQERLAEAGLTVIENNHSPDRGAYWVIAVA